MAKILGLDIGTNSIGWAWLDNETHQLSGGVRLFPLGVDLDTKGKEASHNLARRTARGIRRGYFRYRLRRKLLVEALELAGMLPERLDQTTTLLYALRKKGLDERLELHELGRILLLLNQRRGFKSNKKEKRSDETDKEQGIVKQSISELAEAIKSSHCRTVGEYFNSLLEEAKQTAGWRNQDEPIQRIRSRYVHRSMYLEEFDILWSKQLEYHRTTLQQQIPSLCKKGELVPLREHIRDEVLFFQRPLKSARHLVSNCRYEPKKKAAPKSHPLFQQFRVWETLGKIVVTNEEGMQYPLSLEQKQLVVQTAGEVSFKTSKGQQLLRTSRSEAELRKLLSIPKGHTFNDVPDFKGFDTWIKLRHAIGPNFESFDEAFKHRLYDTLYFATDEEWLFNQAINKLGLNEEQAKAYADIGLEQDYGSLSVKGIRKILPHLEKGMRYDQAVIAAGYQHHSYDQDAEGDERVLEEMVPHLQNNELRNPIVQQAVAETIRLVNHLIKQYGTKPDEIRIELARELKKPKGKREEIRLRNLNTEKLREQYRSLLNAKGIRASKSELMKYELFLELQPETDDPAFKDFLEIKNQLSPRDKQKYELWLECDRISTYSGKPIPLSKLFSSEIEIEHIVPYSRCLDDSFMNKTLCEAHLNKEKKERTPHEWLSGREADWEAFVKRAKKLPEPKQKKLLLEEIPNDFLASQLTNTAYTAVQIRKQLKKAIKKVTITNGQAISHLREMWGLVSLWDAEKASQGVKDRKDHRHHFIDAVTIAATTTSQLQQLSEGSKMDIRGRKFDHRGRLRIPDFQPPWPGFRDKVAQVVNTLLVSYRNERRAVVRRKNPYRYIKRQPEHSNITLAPRGALHEETLYGKIIHPNTKEEITVIRKPLSYLDKPEKLESIVDNKVREVVRQYVAAYGGDPKRALSDKHLQEYPFFMYSEKGKQVPIHKVRLESRLKSPIAIRPDENPKLFVNPGNNFVFALYGEHLAQGKEKKPQRDYQIVSLLEATQRKVKGIPLYPSSHNGLPLLMALYANDMVVTYNESPDEIDWSDLEDIAENRLYRVGKFTGVYVYLAKHNLGKVNLDRDKEPAKILRTYNTLKAIKVRIDSAGNLFRIDVP